MILTGEFAQGKSNIFRYGAVNVSQIGVASIGDYGTVLIVLSSGHHVKYKGKIEVVEAMMGTTARVTLFKRRDVKESYCKCGCGLPTAPSRSGNPPKYLKGHSPLRTSTPRIDAILQFIGKEEKTTIEIEGHFKSVNSIKTTLCVMVKEGYLIRPRRAVYKAVPINKR